jgi:hypothetical protein
MDDKPLGVSVPPAQTVIVEYYQTIKRSIFITNTSPTNILVEAAALRFQSDFGVSTISVSVDCSIELAPAAVHEHVFEITPTPVFLAHTNTFDIKLRYRLLEEAVGEPKQQVFPQPPYAYLVIREPSRHIGKLFISLKQPEDLELGRVLSTMARRAGFEPFLKADNDRITEDIWRDTIEPALNASDVVVVIWTEQTHWKAEGVIREIRLCRALKKREALLLATDTTKPDLYEGTTIEYREFDPTAPARAFAEAVERLRLIILGRH